ncbi:MAG TPA: hypothetical protein DEF34_07825 [Desulfotomaculum sp.]|nr:MAG: hypothetical protein VR67_05870 [Peptococcaceae bacterium BRH_c8a]KJS77593.1 MAG: hypothetical protein JL56_03170 [Desulfotomaculum sp. BICA1-6]HBX23520.1 hypothetical protein [Desulfotomaculum sp.]
MNANKKTLMAVKSFFENQEGWDLDEVISEMVAETGLLKHKDLGDHTLATDECGIEWDGKEICVLSDFIDVYSNAFIVRICNVLDSFVGEDLSNYDFEPNK